MKTTIATTARPNRVLIALAAAWMSLALAIGGAVSAETNADAVAPAPIAGAREP